MQVALKRGTLGGRKKVMNRMCNARLPSDFAKQNRIEVTGRRAVDGILGLLDTFLAELGTLGDLEISWYENC